MHYILLHALHALHALHTITITCITYHYIPLPSHAITDSCRVITCHYIYHVIACNVV